MSENKGKARISIWLAAAILAGTAFGVMLEKRAGQSEYTRVTGDKLSWTLSLIDQKYVDPISRDSLAELAIPEILKKLDPHSYYVSAQDFAKVNEPLTGSFDGIGVKFTMMTDTALVSNVISGGPSYKAGIMAGDMIMTVNDTLIAGIKMDQDKVVSKLRGPRGSKVDLGILRGSSKELVHITVIRGEIPVKSMEAAFMIKPGIGYIRFERFAASTFGEVMQALTLLKLQGAEKYIIDLRGNSGGYLEPAIALSNQFLPEGRMIVYTEGNASERKDYVSDGSGLFQDADLAILIDQGSASASEILAGALQDNDRGTIVGRRSFGKGLVQEQFLYKPDTSAIRLTIARYYTPVGRYIQKPYELGHGEEYNSEVYGRSSEMYSRDSIHVPDSLEYVTLGGKTVYGGGGIIPDVFVPLDTTAFTPYYLKLFQKHLIFKYAASVTESNRQEINSIKNIEQLDEFFSRRNLYYDFIAYANRQGVRPNEEEMTLSRSLIISLLKGYIGQNTELEGSAYYYYMAQRDNIVEEAIKALEGEK